PAGIRQAMPTYECSQRRPLHRCWQAPKSELVGSLDLPVSIMADCLQSACKVPCLLDHEWIVEQREGLKCGKRGAAHGRVQIRISTIEAFEERVRNTADREAVHGPPPAGWVVDF